MLTSMRPVCQLLSLPHMLVAIPIHPLYAVRCCAVLCCAVLCCAVLCCAVLCCAASKGSIGMATSMCDSLTKHCVFLSVPLRLHSFKPITQVTIYLAWRLPKHVSTLCSSQSKLQHWSLGLAEDTVISSSLTAEAPNSDIAHLWCSQHT